MKQGQYVPVQVEKEIVSVYLGTNNFLEFVDVKDVKRFEREFHEYAELKYPEIYENIRFTKELKDDTVALIKKAAQEFTEKFKKN